MPSAWRSTASVSAAIQKADLMRSRARSPPLRTSAYRLELARALADLGRTQRRDGRRTAGQTNRDIAQALSVTEKTVETHLHRTFRTLGMRSRRDPPRELMRDGAGG